MNPDATSSNEKLPDAIWKYLGFNFFNFAAIPVFAGVPMLLFVKQMNGSDTVLGTMAAIPPLAVLLQIPTAMVVAQFGYKKLLLRCWLLSLVAALAVVIIGLLPDRINAGAKIGLLVASLAVFHGLRVVGSTGIWAWIMQLMPENMRGKVLSRDQIVISVANLIVMMGFALLIPAHPGRLFFSIIFGFGFLLLILSFQMARRIPDVPAEAPVNQSTSVPWMAMIKFPPFMKLIIFSAVFFLGFSALAVFWLPILKDMIKASDSIILFIAGGGSVFGIISMLVLGKVIDTVGSRPVIHLCVGILIIHAILWFSLAARLLPFHWSTVLGIMATAGFAMPGFSMSIIRLLMKTAPEMGRSHFFAIFNCVNNLIMGLMPVVWGMFLDAVDEWSFRAGYIEWNRYSILYFILILIFFSSLFLIRRLDEEQAMNEDEFFNQMVMRTPIRAWTRLNDWIFSRFQ